MPILELEILKHISTKPSVKSSGKETSLSFLKLSLTRAVPQASVTSGSVCSIEYYLTELSFGHSFGDTALESFQPSGAAYPQTPLKA